MLGAFLTKSLVERSYGVMPKVMLVTVLHAGSEGELLVGSEVRWATRVSQV
jgi:hypothetical protein